MRIIEFISQPWHWSIAGVMIAVIAFLLLFAGKRFGMSTSFDTLCSMAGAGKKIPYFNFDWRKDFWIIIFVIGTVLGGWIGSTVLQSPEPVRIAASTTESLQSLGITVPQSKADGTGFLPLEIFNFKSLLTLKGFLLIVVGGFLVGFGTRYAGGCTSGHAISGISNLQFGSLIAAIGFFAGGLLMTHLLFPVIFSL